MIKPKVIILSGYGLNCEEETKCAFNLAGGEGSIIHVNDLIESPKNLETCQILAIPGGFAYGDDTGSGNAYALKLKNNLWEKLLKFVTQDKLVIGICNGFQILVNLGLLPAVDGKYGNKEVALERNNNPRYIVRWLDLKIENDTPWFQKINKISLPIAHGEGNFYATTEILKKMKTKKLIAARYSSGKMRKLYGLPINPNGALDNIAAITDCSGRILGIMPHPERAIFFTQLPNWHNLKEEYKIKQINIPEYGPGLKIFKNAVNYYA